LRELLRFGITLPRPVSEWLKELFALDHELNQQHLFGEVVEFFHQT